MEPITRALRKTWELLRKTTREARDDRIVEVSAEVAFFALLSLAPALLVLAGVAGVVGDIIGPDVRETMRENVVTALGSFLSEDVTSSLIRPAVDAMFARGQGGLISFGALVALWSTSRMVSVFIGAMNIAYDIQEWRSVWRRRLLAIGLTLGGLASIAVFVPLLIAGPKLGALVGELAGVREELERLWRLLYWPVIATTGIVILTTLYHFAPNWRTPWRRDLPGAAFGVGLWILAAFVLRVYVEQALNAGTFGPLAAPVVLVLWLYVSAFAVIAGAELNAQIETMWPTPKSGPREGPKRWRLPRRTSREDGSEQAEPDLPDRPL